MEQGKKQRTDFGQVLRKGGIKRVSIRDIHSPIKDVRRRNLLDIDPNGRKDVLVDSIDQEIIRGGSSFEVAAPAKAKTTSASWEVTYEPLFVTDTNGKVYELLRVRGDEWRERLVFYTRVVSRLPFRRRLKILSVNDINVVTIGRPQRPNLLPDLMP